MSTAKVKNKKMFLADLHTHLNEKKIDPEKWWEAVKEKKLSVVAITEHTEYNPESAYRKAAATKPEGILLIPGMEAKTNAGHLLIYAENDSLYKIKELQKINVPIEIALGLARENHFTVSFSHPFGYKFDSVCQIIGEEKAKRLIKKYGAGTEYYNGMLGSANSLVFGSQWVKKLYNFFDFMEKSRAGKATLLSRKSGKMRAKLEKISLETIDRVRKSILFSQNAPFITVGSDAHYPRTIGTAVLALKKKPKNAKDFFGALKKKEILWAGPNIYTQEPVDRLRKKEMLEGLKYLTKKKLQRKVIKGQITNRIKKKLSAKKVRGLAKRIKNRKVVKRLKKKLW